MEEVFKIIGFPAIREGMMTLKASQNGKFQGTIANKTPRGWCTT